MHSQNHAHARACAHTLSTHARTHARKHAEHVIIVVLPRSTCAFYLWSCFHLLPFVTTLRSRTDLDWKRRAFLEKREEEIMAAEQAEEKCLVVDTAAVCVLCCVCVVCVGGDNAWWSARRR